MQTTIEPVRVVAYGHLFELHVVFSERTRFVREDIVNLSKLLI